MKITMYDLLGMVKDGKVPKKIKYDGKIYKYDAVSDDYMQSNAYTFTGLLDDICVFSQLYDEIEIIDDTLEEEKKIPEKLENEHKFYSYASYEGNKNEIDKVLYILKALNLAEEKIDNLNNSINSIIDYLKSKGE